MKHLTKLVLCLAAVLLLLGCALEQIYLETYIDSQQTALETAAGSDDSLIVFVVEQGQSVATVAGNLKAKGLISDTELFRRYVQYKGIDAGIQAGTYTLRKTMTVPEIARTLQNAQAAEEQVTIPEGKRLEEVAILVSEQTQIPSGEFLMLAQTGWRDTALVEEHGFLAQLPISATLEGFLFPDTYRLSLAATAYDLVDRMLDNFAQQVTPEIQDGFTQHNLSLHEGLTLASIVEREAVIAEERPVMAGVYHNRLRDGWLLSACPTVQYALGYRPEEGTWWKSQLYYSDLEVASPYNTYRNLGLPPGPIASPGLDAIRASAQPAVTEYYFFMVDCDARNGSHLFAATEEEHLVNFSHCGGDGTVQ